MSKIEDTLSKYLLLNLFLIGKEVSKQSQSEEPHHSLSLLDIGQYRIKNYCLQETVHYQPSEYSIFQIELLDAELQRYYQGRFILEVWSRSGERIFQKILKEECTSWKLCNNVFLFKSSPESPLIYAMWLHEKKMISIKHPFDDFKEVDMIYFDGMVIVASKNNFKYIQVNPAEVNSLIHQFQTQDDNIQPMLQKESIGLISQDPILTLVANPAGRDLYFICQNEQQQIVPMKFINNMREKRTVSLQKLEIDPTFKKIKLEKRMTKLLQQVNPCIQFQLVIKNKIPYLIVLRQNQIVEVIENFQQTIYVEQIPKLSRLLPTFEEKLTFQFEDGTIAQAQSLDKLHERYPLMETDYYKQLAQPPKHTSIHQVHKNLHFYSDMVVVNQSIFIVRDNIIFLINSSTKQVDQKFFSKQKIIGLYKLKQSTEDEQGYKTTNYKVIALQKNGSLQILTPNEIFLHSDWAKQDQANTPMFTAKDTVITGFQNQSTQSFIYITTLSAQGEQKVYQMMFNTQIIDINLKLIKTDLLFSVYANSRSRELIGVLDQKNLVIYKNDKGQLAKVFTMVLNQLDIKETFNASTIFYFQRDYLLAICKKRIYRISTRANQVDSIKLEDLLQTGGNCFLDGQYFYFLQKGEEDNFTKLGVTGQDMIDAAFANALKQTQNAVVGLEGEGKNVKLYYPTWSFGHMVRRLDYDEFNQVINLMMTNFEIVQIPILHRNTSHFMGMGERQFYLAIKEYEDFFYALDKQNNINCWSTKTGKLIFRQKLTDKDYSQYEVDRKVYDKNWFSYSLIYKQNQMFDAELNNVNAFKNFNYKIIEIDDKGQVHEKLSFDISCQNNMEMHLYFNFDLTQMIEVLINKTKRTKSTYNHYSWSDTKWVFLQQLNQDHSSIEWHHKSLFPYNINLNTFTEVDPEQVKQYELYKFTKDNKVKVLNIQDGIEMVFNAESGKLESFIALQYSFPNTKDSFYDPKCGQFFVQDVSLRLQNYYEYFRRQIFLQNSLYNKVYSIDVSAKNYKYKYLIERSYTYFDYQFNQQILKCNNENSGDKKNKVLDVLKTLSVDHIKRIVHNVFPVKNNTFMHHLAESNLGFESVDFFTQTCKKEGFVIPFLPNLEEMTPLDICVNGKDHKQSNSLVKLLSKKPMDHHSRLISHLLPKLIEMGLPALEKYFDKRRFSTKICNQITLGKLMIEPSCQYKAFSSTLVNDTEDSLRNTMMNPMAKEYQISLEMIDLPLQQMKPEKAVATNNIKLSVDSQSLNTYEIKLIKSLANTENLDIFSQKTIRSFVDFIWPKARTQILQNLLMPYLAFILYYLLYLMILKRLNQAEQKDPAFFKFTSDMFLVYGLMFKLILFLGCFYFSYQDFLQIKNFGNNRIVLWSYANIFPLILMIFIIVYDTFIEQQSPLMEKGFYSASAFFIWIRVLHLLKCFAQTAYMIRMGSEILYRMRYLICFIVISLFAFGFTFFFLADSSNYPSDGIQSMFLLTLGTYDPTDFNTVFLYVLFIMIICFNVFFIFTMLVALSVQAFNQKDNDAWSNEAYQDKAALMALYSYLLQETSLRDPNKKYLVIATVNEPKQRKAALKRQNANGGMMAQDVKNMQVKLQKNIDKKMNTLTVKVERSLKEIQERLDAVGGDGKQAQHVSRSKPKNE